MKVLRNLFEGYLNLWSGVLAHCILAIPTPPALTSFRLSTPGIALAWKQRKNIKPNLLYV